ncbi:MAG: hypothetical protein HYY64_03955, partial [Candidatus Rokubacteria bacterium]|nr:hypothetical protein [Candidatus Rokubacteria bacterium]
MTPRECLLLGLSLTLLAASPGPSAFAHERVNPVAPAAEAARSVPPWIQIASDDPGVQDRLERRFLVGVFRASDGQPVAGARVELLADMRTMPGVHKVPPVLLSPGGEPGTY